MHSDIHQSMQRGLWVLILGLAASGCVAADPVIDIAASASPAEGLTLTWSAVPGRGYFLRSTASLADPWAQPGTNAGPWTAVSNRLSVSVSIEGATRYFRVVEVSSPYNPDWDAATILRSLQFTNQPGLTQAQNGARLKAALLALVPGDHLKIGPGTYSLDSYTTLDLQGTAAAPIWISATPGTVVLTRPDANQNLINLGSSQEARYVCFRGLEFTGGSHGIRVYSATQVWIDQCRVHDTGDVGISANARDTSHLHLTRNEIWNTGGTGEGMYLGGNNGTVIMSRSVIALNHVHDTTHGVSQGDGIEVKQGSWGNWIAENHVHDCNYPCILVYGTAGQPPNLVERNVCYRSNDNTLQVQGECVVRNNLIMAGGGSAFASQPHQGNPTELTVVHNTFVNHGAAVRLASWGVGTNMVFANNACYSETGAALNAVNGVGSTTFAGNVRVGTVTGGITGFTTGAGLADFLDVAWDASRRDARPSSGSMLGAAADSLYAPASDLTGEVRTPPHTSGCYQAH